MSAFDGLNLSPGDLEGGRGSAVTVGVFDGVHRGHVHLARALVERADLAGLRSVVVTFRNHPLSVLRPDFEPMYLCTVQRRVEMLKDTGVDAVVAVTFDAELATLPAEDFVKLLCDRLNMKALVVGPDFALGRGRIVGVLRFLGLLALRGFRFGGSGRGRFFFVGGKVDVFFAEIEVRHHLFD